MESNASGVVVTCYERNDLRCLDILINGYPDQLGLFADHMPRAGTFLFVAHDGIQAFGYLMVTSSSDGTYVHLADVLEPNRRRGIATQMFKFLERTIKNRQKEKARIRYPILLHCFGRNVEAQALYKKIGFHTVCRIPNLPEMYEWQHVMRKNAPTE